MKSVNSNKVDKNQLERKKKWTKEKGSVVKAVTTVFGGIDPESKTILRVLPDLVFVLTKEGIFLDFHAPDLMALLVPPEQFIGRHFKEVLPQGVSEKLDDLIKILWESRNTQAFEYALTVSGKRLQFEARMTIFEEDKFLMIVRDITEQKRLEEELRETYEKYRQLVEYAPAGIYEIDFQNQKFISVNDLICEYMGYTREELLTLHPLEVLTEKSQKIFFERVQKIALNQPVPPLVEYKIKTKQGKELYGAEVIFVSPSITDICGLQDRMHFESWWKDIHPDDLRP
jgi:PAS domain S-box-containing protein